MSEYLVDGEVIQAGRRLPPATGLTTLRGMRVSSLRMLAPPERKPDLSGHGYFAGTFPDGITMVEGVPTSLDVRVLYRPEGSSEIDGYLVAKTTSNPDGTWLVEGLNHNLKYDVICRHEGYNDMILSNVSPALATGLEFAGSFTTLDDQVEILLGTGPYQVDVVDGALPPGVEIQVAGDAMSLVGQPEEWGQFSFAVRVIDSAGISGVFASELVVEMPMPSVIGEEFGGGFYIGDITIADGGDNDGIYAIIMAGVEGNRSAAWKTSLTADPEGMSSDNDGLANTLAMIAAGSDQYPAGAFCFNYEGAGFTDWYLPSINEMGLAWANIESLGEASISVGGDYWVSTARPGTSGANYISFMNGNSGSANKNRSKNIRPVRRLKRSESE